MPFQSPSRYGRDRLRQIFIDHWSDWWDLHQLEVPADQRAYVCETVGRLMGCCNPECGYAGYVCPGSRPERIVPFSCKTRCCPSCGKVKVDRRVNTIALDWLDVPHLHLTLTTDDILRPFFYQQRSLLKVLLSAAAQAVREVLGDLYPAVGGSGN